MAIETLDGYGNEKEAMFTSLASKFD